MKGRPIKSVAQLDASKRAPQTHGYRPNEEVSGMGHHESEAGSVTGTMDKDYNLTWFVQSCLANALRLETYMKDAARVGDAELSELFTKAQADSLKGAEARQAPARNPPRCRAGDASSCPAFNVGGAIQRGGWWRRPSAAGPGARGSAG